MNVYISNRLRLKVNSKERTKKMTQKFNLLIIVKTGQTCNGSLNLLFEVGGKITKFSANWVLHHYNWNHYIAVWIRKMK